MSEQREKLRKLIIESIHGLPYEEAIKKDKTNLVLTAEEREDIEMDCGYFSFDNYLQIQPITIGRVMQAFPKHTRILRIDASGYIDLLDLTGEKRVSKKEIRICDWKLTKENGQECTLEDQTDETIEKLLNILEQTNE